MSNIVEPTLSYQSAAFYFSRINSVCKDCFTKSYCRIDQQSAFCCPIGKSCIGTVRRIVKTEKGETAKILPFPQAPAFAK